MDGFLFNYSKIIDNKVSLSKYYWTLFFFKSESKTALMLKNLRDHLFYNTNVKIAKHIF